MRQSGILCIILFALTACTTVHERPPAPLSKTASLAAWATHRVHLDTIQTWSLKGRIAGKSNNEGFRAGVRWQQQQQVFNIDLYGPLGRKTAVISGKEGDVQVNTSRGEHYFARDSEALMQDLFGYALPVNGLRYWVRGVPDPGQVYALLELDAWGRLKHLRQAGWSIDYDRYHEGKPALPAFIVISSSTLNVKIIIDRWFLDAASP